MKRYSLLVLFGMSLVQSVTAQNVLPAVDPAGGVTNETMDLNVSVDSARVKSNSQSPDVPIFKDGFSKGQIGVPYDEQEATNAVVDPRMRFFVSAGLEYADEGELDEAERAYNRALELDPDNEDILFRQGTLYARMERFADAVAIFERLADRHPENPLLHNNLAWCYATGAGTKNVIKALRHAREALIFAPQSPSMWNTLAEAYYLAGDYEKALRSTDYALELLSRSNPEEAQLESFEAQRAKIILARDALKMMDGLDD